MSYDERESGMMVLPVNFSLQCVQVQEEPRRARGCAEMRQHMR